MRLINLERGRKKERPQECDWMQKSGHIQTPGGKVRKVVGKNATFHFLSIRGEINVDA